MIPSCLRNLMLEEEFISICSPSAYPNLTTTTLGYGCKPEEMRQSHTVDHFYQISKDKGKKIVSG